MAGFAGRQSVNRERELADRPHRFARRCCCGIAILALVGSPHRGAAQPGPSVGVHPGRTLQLVRTSDRPSIDGVIDDRVWRLAPVTSSFGIARTGGVARASTDVRVVADDTALYFAFSAVGKNQGARPGNREQLDDRVTVMIDLDRNGRNVAWFSVTAGGETHDNIGARERWRAATRRTRSGWTAEMAIPLTLMPATLSAAAFDVTFVRYHADGGEWSRSPAWTSAGPVVAAPRPPARTSATPGPVAAPMEAAPLTVVPARAGYVLQPGDSLQIKHFNNPELNELLPIRPDGRLSLDLVGEVTAAGLTPLQLQSFLTERYSRSLRNPQVVVIVKEFGGNKVYVGGEVNSPGVFIANRQLTLVQALVEAGGWKRSAEMRNIVILRDQGTTQPLFFTVDLKDLQKGTTRDVQVQPGDIIFVPKTRITRMNDFVSQYVNELIPIPVSLGLGYVFDRAIRR